MILIVAFAIYILQEINFNIHRLQEMNMTFTIRTHFKSLIHVSFKIIIHIVIWN